MVVGVSGSGKSSLLADTLATEVNSRMRRFLGVQQPHLGRGEVPAFIGPVPPGVHFAQRAFRASRRTTVGTSSGLLSLLRRYFSRYSTPWAEQIESAVPLPSPSSYAAWLKRHYTGSLVLWSVVERWQRSDGTRAVASLLDHGITTAVLFSETDSPSRREQGRTINLEKFLPLNPNTRHLIEAEVGRLHVSGKCPELEPLLEYTFEIGGDVIVEFSDEKRLPSQFVTERGVQLDSALHWVHPEVLEPFFGPSEALLSFNSPTNPRSGACKSCGGLGTSRNVLVDLLASRPERSMHDGCFSIWTEKNYRYVNIQHDTIEGLRGVDGFSPDIPWRDLGSDAQCLVLYGSGSRAVADIDRGTGRKTNTPRVFRGFIPEILRRAEGKGSASPLANLVTGGVCQECGGSRWSREALALRLGQWNIREILATSFEELLYLSEPRGPMQQQVDESYRALAPGLHALAAAFVKSGLGHLSGERGMTSLSAGESRRSRLATLLQSRGEGLLLMLDEPARGLHEADLVRLSSALTELKRRHTLIINEHRVSLASVADQLVELGPGAGSRGGEIVFSGSPARRKWWLSGSDVARRPLPVGRKDACLKIVGARIHTLADVDCRIPLGRLVSVTGVSGSGKSSFVRGVLVPAMAGIMPDRVDCEDFAWRGGSWNAFEGASPISSVLALEPRAPVTQRRSTVATALGLADGIRRIFGRSPEAKRRKLKPTDFGWNAGEGRCQTCLGMGEIDDDGGWVTCPDCGGRRFDEDVLGVRVYGQSVADILSLSLVELREHPLAVDAGWCPLLERLVDLDLGYLALGRRMDQISGGEHQRLRIAQTLVSQSEEGLLLVLDEPSAGLHPSDVARLLRVLDAVVAEGANSVILVEHNLDLIRSSDWIIDFGPGGGPEGGRIVGHGSPDDIAKLDTPTGRALAGKLSYSKVVVLEPSPVPAEPQEEDSETSAQRARLWLRQLIGENVPAERLGSADLDGLAVQFDAESDVTRPYEVGGLDIEIGRLLLDPSDEADRELDELAQVWLENPEAQLCIHPWLEEIRIWGSRLPASAVRSGQDRQRRMGLISVIDGSAGSDPVAARATGMRFRLSDATVAEALQHLKDALTVGGGYVELVDQQQRVIGVLRRRSVNLSSSVPAVAPFSASAASLSRSHAMGCCPCCRGVGLIWNTSEGLIVGSPDVEPLHEDFLDPEALSVLRGVRRNSFLPFFKRLISEGLWPKDRAFNQLDLEERTILMHGYWARPGHGSFLKTPKAKPEDVRSWLRWDGLFPVIRMEAERSKNSEWRKQLQASSQMVECPRCQGTGLQLHSQAVALGEHSLFEWVRDGTVGEFCGAIEGMKSASRRSERMKVRILHCLGPLRQARPQARLRRPVEDIDLLRAVFGRVVGSMIRLRVLD